MTYKTNNETVKLNYGMSDWKTCVIPCQWMTTPSVWSLLVSSILRISPARALMVGPGNWPLMPITTLSMQSGDQCMYSTSHFRFMSLARDEWTRIERQVLKKKKKALVLLEQYGSTKKPMFSVNSPLARKMRKGKW